LLQISIQNLNELVAFWLIFTRWLTISFQLPIFDNVAVPTLIKILTAMILSYAFFPLVNKEVLIDIKGAGENAFWFLTIGYSITGLLIGYFVKSIMNIFIASGSIITQAIGFGAVRYFDPSAGAQIGPFEKMIQWTMIIIIISSGALIPMFKGIYLSFFTIHLADLNSFHSLPVFFMDFFKGIFMASLMLASPFVFTNILITSVLGIISRVVPQMNVIMVSFVVNIGIGLMVFWASSSEFFHTAFKFYTDNLGIWFKYLSL